ncbi:MAG: hypothetical protein RLZZ65_1808 [Bacteroidota bacterium]|jgi:hypothetical protein
MKLLTAILFSFGSVLAWSQVGPIDFQSNGYGANWQWTTFENGSNPPVEVIVNPAQSGINLSSHVAKFTALVSGAPWAGFESVHGQGIGLFNLTAANCEVKLMVYKSVISPVGVKFATPSGASTGEILVSNTLVNQWEELTFNFSQVISAPSSVGIDQIIIFPDFNQRADNNICYIDNIKFSNQDGTQNLTPMEPAPTPNYPAASVIALFSNPYTEVPVDTWQAGWSQGQLTDLQIQGNDTKRFSSLNFVGIETVGAHVLDLSSMTHLRLDYWTANINPFKIKLVDFGADGQYAGGNDSESELSFQPVSQAWNTLEVPLSQFSSLNNLSHFAQLILSGTPAGTGVVFIDNVLFFNENLAALEDHKNIGLRVYPNPSQDLLFMEASERIQSLSCYDQSGILIGQFYPKGDKLEINTQVLKPGIYLLEMTFTESGSRRIEKIIVQ